MSPTDSPPFCPSTKMHIDAGECDISLHLDYRHAESWEEAEEAVEAHRLGLAAEVFDTDGDQVLAVKVDEGMYQFLGGEGGWIKCEKVDYYILIPTDEEFVTASEVQEAIESIKRSFG